jgi:hypothetical protein
MTSFITPCHNAVTFELTNYPQNQGFVFNWYKVGVADPIAVTEDIALNTTIDGDYYVIVSSSNCTSTPASETIHFETLKDIGDPSVFGENQWNVYYFANGGYAGYYIEPSLSFNTPSTWDPFIDPTTADGFIGCDYRSADNAQFSAKRKGFPCGHYSIAIPSHYKDAVLYINGVQVWAQQGENFDLSANVWEGDLGPESEAEFVVTRYSANDPFFGAIAFNLIDDIIVPKPTITPPGPINICSVDNVMLTSSASAGNTWNTGETTQSITVNTAGFYWVTVTGAQGCTKLSESVNVTVTPAQAWYADTDGDAYGDVNVTKQACEQPAGYVSNSDDCDDTNAAINPATIWYLDASNSDDCDDTNAAINPATIWYLDADNDGRYFTTVSSCDNPGPGYNLTSTLGRDCDDNNAAVWQSKPLYIDADGDGYNAGQTKVCFGTSIPSGYSQTTLGGDCNDHDAAIHASVLYYLDADHDGYGSLTTAMLCSSAAPYGYSTKTGDCNDNNANVSPGAAEICGNGIDDNCNGLIDENCCGVVTNLTTTNITATSAQVNWVAFVNPVQWQLQYKSTAPGSKWADVFAAGSARSALISGLKANQSYNWHIRAKCGKTWTAYSTTITFKTPSTQAAIAQTLPKEESGNLKLYPNPTSGRFVVQLTFADKITAKAEIQLTNMLGRTVQTETADVIDGSLQKTIDASPALTKGIYVVRIVLNGNTYKAELVYTK